jgi:serine/threonine protein kinase
MLPETRARRYFAQLLSGVKHIHANGFCHRDIKPENCMVEAATDTLKIIDFGARAARCRAGLHAARVLAWSAECGAWCA